MMAYRNSRRANQRLSKASKIGLLIPGRPMSPSEGRAQHYRREGDPENQLTKTFNNGTTIAFGSEDPVATIDPGQAFFEQTLVIIGAEADIMAIINKYKTAGRGRAGTFDEGSDFGDTASTDIELEMLSTSIANVYQNKFYRANIPGLAHPGFSTDTRHGVRPLIQNLETAETSNAEKFTRANNSRSVAGSIGQRFRHDTRSNPIRGRGTAIYRGKRQRGEKSTNRGRPYQGNRHTSGMMPRHIAQKSTTRTNDKARPNRKDSQSFPGEHVQGRLPLPSNHEMEEIQDLLHLLSSLVIVKDHSAGNSAVYKAYYIDPQYPTQLPGVTDLKTPFYGHKELLDRNINKLFGGGVCYPKDHQAIVEHQEQVQFATQVALGVETNGTDALLQAHDYHSAHTSSANYVGYSIGGGPIIVHAPPSEPLLPIPPQYARNGGLLFPSESRVSSPGGLPVMGLWPTDWEASRDVPIRPVSDMGGLLPATNFNAIRPHLSLTRFVASRGDLFQQPDLSEFRAGSDIPPIVCYKYFSYGAPRSGLYDGPISAGLRPASSASSIRAASSHTGQGGLSEQWQDGR